MTFPLGVQMSEQPTTADLLARALDENRRLHEELNKPVAGAWQRGHAKTAGTWTRRDPHDGGILASTRAEGRAAEDTRLRNAGYRLLGEPAAGRVHVDGGRHIPASLGARALIDALRLPTSGEYLDDKGRPLGGDGYCRFCNPVAPWNHTDASCPAHVAELAYHWDRERLRDAAPQLYTALRQALDDVDRLTVQANEHHAQVKEAQQRITREVHARQVLFAWMDGSSGDSADNWFETHTRVYLRAAVGRGVLATTETTHGIEEGGNRYIHNIEAAAYDRVRAERRRQIAKWGRGDHPNVCPVLSGRPGGATPQRYAEDLEIPTADRARFILHRAAETSRLSWTHILVEELAEAVEAAAVGERRHLQEELAQVAAVAVAWLEALEVRGGTHG